MKILVFDHCLKVTGHRLPYAALVADSFGDKHEVILCLPAIIEQHPQVSAYLNRSFAVEFYPAKGNSGALSKSLEARKSLVKLVNRHQPNLVAIPTGDGLAIVTGLLNLIPFVSLRKPRIDICLMRGLQRYPKQPFKRAMANLKWWLVRRGPWQRILLIDPREWSRTIDPATKRVFLCPDPVPEQRFVDRQRARELLNLPSEGRIIVSVGNQNIRKGSDLLVKAFATAKLNPTDHLVMIGKIEPAIAPLIESLKQQPGFEHLLIVRDEFVTEDEFQMAIVASDLVAIPYRSVDRPSGIVCRSMAWNRPIIASNRGWLKWILEEFDAGFAANPEDATEFGNAIKLALDQSCEFKTTKKAREFINYNTEQNYMHVWRNGLERAADSVTAGPLSFLQNTETG